MNRIFTVIFCIAIPLSMCAAAAQPSYKVTYDGGSLPNVKAGAKLRLYVDSSTVRFVKDKTGILTIPATAITDVSYGQGVHQRLGTDIGLSKKPVIGLSWANDDQRGALAIQCENDEYRVILALLAGVSGKKAVHSEPQMDEVAEQPDTTYVVTWETVESGTTISPLAGKPCAPAWMCQYIDYTQKYTRCIMTLETNDMVYAVHRNNSACFTAGQQLQGKYNSEKGVIEITRRCCVDSKHQQGKIVTEYWNVDSTSLK
jgi:hypothetical protein